MITAKINQLAIAKAKAAKLESDIARELPHELAALPARFGFPDLAAFVRAIKTVAGSRRRSGSSKKSHQPGRRKRAKITDAIKAQVKKLAKAGKTGAEIVKATGISLPSVQNIKKALGLVNPRKSASVKPKS